MRHLLTNKNKKLNNTYIATYIENVPACMRTQIVAKKAKVCQICFFFLLIYIKIIFYYLMIPKSEFGKGN